MDCRKRLTDRLNETYYCFDEAYRLPRGAHEGELLSDVPRDYLEWLKRELSESNELHAAAAHELCRRGY